MTTHSTVTVWSPSTIDPTTLIHYLVTLAVPDSTEPGPLVGRITRHPDLGGALSARLYKTHSTSSHTPLGCGFRTIDAAAHAITVAYDAARLVSLTASTDQHGATPITVTSHGDEQCPSQYAIVPGHLAVGDYVRCETCDTHHVLTGATMANAVDVVELVNDGDHGEPR